MMIDDFIGVEKIKIGERACTKFSIKEKNYELFTNVLERLDDFADHTNSIEPRVNESLGGGVMGGLLVEEVFAKYLNTINKQGDKNFATFINKKTNNLYFILMKNKENMVFNLFFADDKDYDKVIETAKFPKRQNVNHNIGIVFNGKMQDVYNQIISYKELEFVAFTGFNQSVYSNYGYKQTINQRGNIKEVTLINSANIGGFNDYLKHNLGHIL